jgi:hypothetical protein
VLIRVIQAAAACVLAAVSGCASGPDPAAPGADTPPAAATSAIPDPDPRTGFTLIVSGSGDSVGALPGSASRLYTYRFRQLEPSGADGFTFRDRDLSFYFRPTPGALHFQVENLQDRPVWIDWDRSKFIDPFGSVGKVANSSSRWVDRFGYQAPTQIPGLQRYGDYLLPFEYLVDPGDRTDQLHRPLLPEDSTAPQFTDRIFGVDLSLRVEDTPRTYSFRYKVSSVIPR